MITRPAQGGERLGRVVAQYPAKGTLSSFDTVRDRRPRSRERPRSRDVTGLTLAEARAKLARHHLAGLVQTYARESRAASLQQFPKAGLRVGRQHDDQAGRRALTAKLRETNGEPASP